MSEGDEGVNIKLKTLKQIIARTNQRKAIKMWP